MFLPLELSQISNKHQISSITPDRDRTKPQLDHDRREGTTGVRQRILAFARGELSPGSASAGGASRTAGLQRGQLQRRRSAKSVPASNRDDSRCERTTAQGSANLTESRKAAKNANGRQSGFRGDITVRLPNGERVLRGGDSEPLPGSCFAPLRLCVRSSFEVGAVTPAPIIPSSRSKSFPISQSSRRKSVSRDVAAWLSR